MVGLAAGALNGFLVTRFRLPPFIVTLGTLNIFIALTLLYSNRATIRSSAMPPLLTWTGTTFPVGPVRISTGVVMMLLLYIAVAFILGKGPGTPTSTPSEMTRKPPAWPASPVNRVLMSVYLAAGAVLAVGAWIQIGRTNAASPNGGVDLNLDSITAVVIGGTSLFGGRGSVWGTLLGALIVGVFRNGLSLAGLDVLYQTLAVGVLIIVAVSVDQWIRKVKS